MAVLQTQLYRLHRLESLRSPSTLNLLLATLAGMAAPLSVYVAVPVSAGLIAGGMAPAVVVSFLFTCPLIDPNLLVLTYGALGWQIAAARVAAAFALGLGAGLLYRRYGHHLPLDPPPELSGISGRHGSAADKRSFRLALWKQAWFIVKIFSISLLLSAAIKALVSPQFINAALGDKGQASVLVAMVLGIPFYQCGGASIPIMRALYELGMSPGAILAFFISGPATKLPAMYAFREGYGLRFLAAFLTYTLAGAFLAGVLFNLLY
ncbi:MAG: permease [Candidatus Glassbacteria bacterium]|nr:permease [Candidatus Glassbacteria bacterium]